MRFSVAHRGLGRAGVAISPAPPKRFLMLAFSSLKAALRRSGIDQSGTESSR
jgi:hypothetical protein